MGCSPQLGALPQHHSLPSLSPVSRTPEGLEGWGGDKGQLGSSFSLLEGMGSAQMGQDVVGLGAAETHQAWWPLVHGADTKQGKRRQNGVVGNTGHRGWVYCPPRPRASLCPGTLDLRPWTLSWAAKGSQPLPGLPGCSHARKREKWLPLTFLLEIAMPKKAPGRDLVLALLPSRIAMNPEFGSEKETGYREVRRLGSPAG